MKLSRYFIRITFSLLIIGGIVSVPHDSFAAPVSCEGAWHDIEPTTSAKSIVGAYLSKDKNTQATTAGITPNATDAVAAVAQGNDNVFYYNWYKFSAQTWSGWQRLTVPTTRGLTTYSSPQSPGISVGAALDVMALGFDGKHYHVINWGNGWRDNHTEASPHVQYGGQTQTVDGQGRTWNFRASPSLQYKCVLAGGGVTPSQNTPPFGSLDVPARSAIVSGTVKIEGWVLDQNQTTRPTLRFYVDNGAVSTGPVGDVTRSDVCSNKGVIDKLAGTPCNPNSGFSFSWNAATVPDGSHTLRVDALDNQNLSAIIGEVIVSVQNPKPQFSVGDRVQTTAEIKVRQNPGLSSPSKGTQPAGVQGTVRDISPSPVDGYVWLYVDYDNSSIDGWSAQNWLVIAPPSQTPVIDSIAPNSGTAGAVIAILGKGFSDTNNTVTFASGGTTLKYPGISGKNSGTGIEFVIPSVNPGTWSLSVTNNGGLTSNSLPFTVNASQLPPPLSTQYSIRPTA